MDVPNKSDITWDAPFCSQYGHVPMVGNLRRCWMEPEKAATAQAINASQRKQATIAFRTESDQWTAFVDQAGQSVLHRMTQVTPQMMNSFLTCMILFALIFISFFPNMPNRPNMILLPRTSSWINGNIVGPCYRSRRSPWHTCSQHGGMPPGFQCLKRQAQSHAKQVRQLRFMEVTESATAAASRHDSHALFQIINKFSLKQPKPRMQLRNPHGHIANPIEEAAMLRQFIRDTWQGPSHFPFPASTLTGLPFTAGRIWRLPWEPSRLGKRLRDHARQALHGNRWPPWLHLHFTPFFLTGG